MQIDHQCPQCGGTVTLEETDNLLQCVYCRSSLIIEPKDYFRYLFPAPDSIREEIIFIPYWRFRGMHFSCRTAGIKNTVIDKNFIALGNKTLPATLGIRPQSMKLHFARKIDGAKFLRPELPFEISSVETKNKLSYDIVTVHETRLIGIDGGKDMAEVQETRTELKEDRLYHESFVAEKVSIIYTPLFIRNNEIYDAIQTKPVSCDIERINISGDTSVDDWTIKFLPTLCPDCGWDLIAERDSCVLLCNHCNKAWDVFHGALRPVKYAVAFSGNPQTKTTHLPFWKIGVEFRGIDLKSHKDLVKLANLPKIIRAELNTSNPCFWVPAFKVAPPLFLRTARQMTIANPERELREEFNDLSFYPVNVTLDEALESLKVILTNVAINKKDMMPRLEEITIAPVESLLVFHPFIDSNYELTEPEIPCGLMKNALKWGKNL